MSHPAAEPHLPLNEVLDGIFFLHGSIRIGPGLRINRNMIVVKHGAELTLLNPVRLVDDGELDKLGQVTHIVRLGYHHGQDDSYYADKYPEATFWCQDGSDNFARPKPGAIIREGGDTPLPDSKFFVFHDTKNPECALLIERHAGVLVTCDSVQHHIDTTNCSFLGRVAMSLMGFKRPMNIGPPWRRKMTKESGSLEADFRRLLELEFDHGAGGHGQFCLGGAKDKLADTVASVFGK